MEITRNINIKCAFHLFLIVFFILQFISCINCTPQYTYTPPKKIEDSLKVGSLSEVRIDTSLITKAVERIKCGKYNEIHSMLIYKDDKLVLEEYFKGYRYQWDGPNYHGALINWDLFERQRIMSCTKSFISTMVAVAIQNGYINSVHQSIFDYLPNHQHFKTKEKAKITIEHLLTMTSGLEWDEWSAAHGTTANDIDLLYTNYSNNPLACVLERSLVSTPGQEFTYNGGGFIVLGKILENASQMSLEEFANDFLFRPLGIDSASWYQFNNGDYATDGSLNITPRDMLKLGILYLHNGNWKNRQIIAEDWVNKSKIPYNNNVNIDFRGKGSGETGYSYSWWTTEYADSNKKFNLFGAGGWGGQEIIVLPEESIVVVFTGSSFASKTKTYKILEKYILPAINQ